MWRLPALHTHVCTCRAQMPSRSALEAWLQPGEQRAARGCPLTHPGLAAGPLPSSAQSAQAESPWPTAASVQLSPILSLESQIPAVVWENKCAERAEYLMGPFSDLNDSGNEPPLSYGCQRLLLSWLPRSQELCCQSDPAPCRGVGCDAMGCAGYWGRGEAPWGWKWLMQHVPFHFVPIGTMPVQCAE